LRLWAVVRRRWQLVLIPFVVVLALGLLTYHRPAPAYNVGIRYSAGQPPAEGSGAEYEDDRYFPWLTSEYIVNGLRDWVTSGSFAEAVSEELARQGVEVSPGAVRGSTAAENVRSILLVSMTYGDRDLVEKMINAATTVLQTRNAEAFPHMGEGATVVALDRAVVNRVPAGLRAALDLPLRLVLAVGAGLALAFLADYMDPRIWGRRELEEMGLVVLAEIPRSR